MHLSHLIESLDESHDESHDESRDESLDESHDESHLRYLQWSQIIIPALRRRCFFSNDNNEETRAVLAVSLITLQ